MNTLKANARTAGVLYLMLIITGIFGFAYVPSQIVVDGDAKQTVNNIIDSGVLYRAGMVSELVCQLCFVLLALALFRLFREVNIVHASLLLGFVIVAVPIAFVNVVNEMAALSLLSGDSYLGVFSTEQLNAQVMFFQKLHGKGILVVEIFWGLWLFPFGYLVYTSGLFPKVLGILLIVGCIAYLVDFMIILFVPQYVAVTYVGSALGTLGEFGIAIYLLVKGVRSDGERHTGQTLQSANLDPAV